MPILDRPRELWQHRGPIYNLATRDQKVRHKSSALGIAWSWLNPLLIMVCVSIIDGPPRCSLR